MQSKRKSDTKKGRSQSSGEDVVWFSFICAFCRLLSSTSPMLFTCDALMLIVCAAVSVFFFLEEVPPPTASRTLEEEMATAAFQGVEEEAPSGGITKETG